MAANDKKNPRNSASTSPKPADAFSNDANESKAAKPGAKSAERAMIQIPRGTLVSIELVDPISSGKSKIGDTFRGRVDDGIWIKGRVALPPGTTVRGAVTDAAASGRIKGKARLSLSLLSFELDGSTYVVHTDTLSYLGEGHTGQQVGSWLGGALQGALYGVLFGGKEGAVIGAGAGAAAGAGMSALGGKLDVEFKQGAKLMFEMSAPVSVPEPPPGSQGPPQPAVAPKSEEKTPAEKGPEKPASKESPKPESKPTS